MTDSVSDTSDLTTGATVGSAPPSFSIAEPGMPDLTPPQIGAGAIAGTLLALVPTLHGSTQTVALGGAVAVAVVTLVCEALVRRARNERSAKVAVQAVAAAKGS